MRTILASPAALLLGAIAGSILAVPMVWQSWEAYAAGRADDLSGVEAQLSGPQSQRRGIHDRWTAWDGDRRLGGFTTDGGDSAVLIWNRDDVTARLAGDIVVDVVTPSGYTVRSLDVGARGAVQDLSLALLPTAGALGLGRLAVRRRRAWRGWTRRSGPEVTFVDGSTMALAVGSSVASVAIRVGLEWQAAVVLAAAVMALVVWGWRRHSA